MRDVIALILPILLTGFHGNNNINYISIRSLELSDKPIFTVVISKVPLKISNDYPEYNIIASGDNYSTALEKAKSLCVDVSPSNSGVAEVVIKEGRNKIICRPDPGRLCSYLNNISQIGNAFSYISTTMVRYRCRKF